MLNNPFDVKLSSVHFDKNKKLGLYLDTLPAYVRENPETVSYLTPVVLDTKSLNDFKDFIHKVYGKAGGRITIQSVRAGFFIKDKTHSFAVMSKGMIEKDLQIIFSLFKERYDLTVLDTVFDRQKKAIKVLEKGIKYWKRPIGRALFSPLKVYDKRTDICYGWEVEEVIPIFKPTI